MRKTKNWSPLSFVSIGMLLFLTLNLKKNRKIYSAFHLSIKCKFNLEIERIQSDRFVRHSIAHVWVAPRSTIATRRVTVAMPGIYWRRYGQLLGGGANLLIFLPRGVLIRFVRFMPNFVIMRRMNELMYVPGFLIAPNFLFHA